jgi:hypothetical protein
MARKAKRPVKRKTSAKKPAKKKGGVRKVAKRNSRKIKAVKKTARAVAKSVRQKTIATKKAGKGIVRRAVEAVAQAVAPLLPGGATDKPKGD